MAAKPANDAKVTPAVDAAQPGVTASEAAPDTLAETKKPTNLLPTVIVLSIVIGCVAIVSISKKIT